ncbi:MAG: PilZ domain-containing protein [Myxococcaceae bacterium]
MELANQQFGAVGAILLDLALPGAQSLELVKTLQRLCAGPVLAMTADDPSSDPVLTAARLTGQKVMDKRVPCERLVSALNLALRRVEPLPVCDRVPFFSVVEFRAPGEEAWGTGFSYDLSPRGIFVTTLTPAAPGAALELRVVFPGRGAQLCRGQVVWSNELSSRATFSYRVGMGVQLTGGDEAFTRVLTQFTASAVKSAKVPA